MQVSCGVWEVYMCAVEGEHVRALCVVWDIALAMKVKHNKSSKRRGSDLSSLRGQ